MTRTVVARLPDWRDEDQAAFEPVLDALDLLTPYVEVLRPGCAAMPLRSLAGDEAEFCEHLIDTVTGLTGLDCLTGVADGLFAAILAAGSGRIVPVGRDAEFLAPRDIADLRATGLIEPEDCETLRHLGIGTLGAFCSLPAAAVAERFGVSARRAQAIAAGQLARPLAPRQAEPELTVTTEAEEPYETVEQALFAARPLSERLLKGLADRNLTCARVTVTARTVRGLTRSRTWQLDPAAPSAELARRVRWQLEGWMSGHVDACGDVNSQSAADAIAELELAPGGLLGLIEAGRGLWEVKDAATTRAEAALRHTQGLLGPEAVLTVTDADGRGPAERHGLAPWSGEAVPPRSGPWPGSLPDPLPARTGTEGVEVQDATGQALEVSARGALSAIPAFVAFGGERVPIIAWAGPWPLDERWWDETAARRYARLQVHLADGRAALLHLEHRRWKVGGWYD